MPRTETVLHESRLGCWAEIEVCDSFTRRCEVHGILMRGDGAGLWSARGFTWKGAPPAEWDEAQAIDEEHEFRMQYEVDYS